MIVCLIRLDCGVQCLASYKVIAWCDSALALTWLWREECSSRHGDDIGTHNNINIHKTHPTHQLNGKNSLKDFATAINYSHVSYYYKNGHAIATVDTS